MSKLSEALKGQSQQDPAPDDRLAKEAANGLLNDLRIYSPDLLRHLKEICCTRGAYVKEGDLKDAEGRLVVSGDKGIITVNPNPAYSGRTRFSIAHELGHFEMHRDSDQYWNCTAKEMNEWSNDLHAHAREIEANEFAAELLMPEKFIAPQFQSERPDLGYFKDLATKYRVSLTAVLHRYIELTHEACAVVFSKGGMITRSWKSPLFEKQKYWIPKNRKIEEFAPKMQEVDASKWFRVPKGLSGEQILEQSQYFKNLDMGVTLLWLTSGKLVKP